MWRWIVSIPLIAHGLANLGGVFAPFTKSGQGFNLDQAWLFSRGITLRSPVGRAWSLLWLVSTIALVGAGLGAIFRQEWWLPLAITGSFISFISIAPWWKAVPPGARFGAIFDLIVLAILLSPLGQQLVVLVGG